MRKYFPIRSLLLVLLGVLGSASLAFATSFMSTSGRVALNVGDVIVTTFGSNVTATTAPTGTDSRTSSTKTSGVHKLTLTTPNDVSSGTAVAREIDVLYRIQERGGAIYVDFVFDATITSLSNTVSGMNIASPGHPSPTKDAIDKQALVSAGGS